MRQCTCVIVAAAAVLLVPSSASGQGEGLSCRGHGISFAVAGVDSLGATLRLPQSMDTTLVFNLPRREWSSTDFAGSITASIGDTRRSTTYLCAGVSVLLERVTMVVLNARGTVRFRASVEDVGGVSGRTSQSP